MIEVVAAVAGSTLITACWQGAVGGYVYDGCEWLRKKIPQGTPENHDVLKAMHKCFRQSVKLMATAADGLHFRDDDSRTARRKLSRYSSSKNLANLDLVSPDIPYDLLENQIRAIYGQQDVDAQRAATDFVITYIEGQIGCRLTPALREVFHGSDGDQIGWAPTFELLFSHEIKTNGKVRDILVSTRLNELLKLARKESARIELLLDRLERLESKVDDGFTRQEELFGETQVMIKDLADGQKKHLEASHIALPFQNIHYVQRLYGKAGEHLAPTSEEYAMGRVHTPGITELVEKTLLDEQGALVSGHGSSGKTTLSILIAHRPSFKGKTCYYLDLTGRGDDQNIDVTIVEKMIRFGDEETLFILDNAHLAPGIAATAVSHWREIEARPKLLILSRQTARLGTSWKIDEDLSAIGLTELELRNEAADLQGAYSRLFHQRHGRDAGKVPEARLSQWMALFQGDLIAFSAAVLHRIKDPHWDLELTAYDARKYVRDRYLDTAPAERDGLVSLAALYSREISMPVGCLEAGALSGAMESGLVWIEARGANSDWKFFRLVHPGVGSLILQAAGISESDAAKIRQSVLLDAPTIAAVSGGFILAKGGHVEETKELFGALWSEDDFPAGSLPLHYWRRFFADSIAYGSVSADEIDGRAKNWVAERDDEDICRSATAIPLQFLTDFLRHMEAAMPNLWTGFTASLMTEASSDRLVKKAHEARLQEVTSFLRYTQSALPQLWDKVVASIISESAITPFAKRAITFQLHFLTNFLRYAREPIPLVWEAVWQALLDCEDDELAQALLGSSLDKMAGFLNYVDETDEDGDLRERLNALPRMEEFSGQFERLLCSAQPDHLAAFAYLDFWSEANFAKLTEADLERNWPTVEGVGPGWFTKFCKLCTKLGRADLAEWVAFQIVLKAGEEHFEAEQFNIKNLSQILYWSRSQDAGKIHQFLDRCFSADWLDGQYKITGAHLPTLAGALTEISLSPSPEVREFFVRPTLLARLEQQAPVPGSMASHVASWLQTLGAACLVFPDIALGKKASIPSETIVEALGIYPATPSGTGIQKFQSQLWVGLYQWLHLRELECHVDGGIAEGILADFIAADPQDDLRRARLNAAMVEWLQQAKASGWKLAPPKRSLFEA